MRRYIKKLDIYLVQANMICQYKLEIVKDFESYRDERKEELNDLYNEQNKLHYKRKVMVADAKKDKKTLRQNYKKCRITNTCFTI